MSPRSFRVWGSTLLAAVLVVLATAAAAVEVRRVEAGGVEAWLVEDRSNPVLSVSIAFRGGSSLDPDGKWGLAAMASALLDEGAGDLDARAFQGQLEDLAADLGFSASRDAVYGNLRTLSANRDAAFALLGLAVTAPRFDPDAVERVRGQMQASLRRRAEDPDDAANRRFFTAMFPGHPYGRPVEGTPESLAAIGLGDLKAFAAGRLARDALVIGVVGDITPDQLRGLLVATFAGLPATAAPATVPDLPPAAEGQIIVVEMPARQSAVVFGQRGLPRRSPEFDALSVVNQVLGGSGLNSRLFDEVREKRGLAYSVYTSPMPMQHSALWLGRAGTANERVAETVAVIREQWERLAAGGITEAELADARTYLTGSFPLRFTSNRRIADILVAMQLERLGIDWLDRRNGLIEAVTLADANRLARSLLDSKALAFVIAGEPEGIPGAK